MTRYLLLTLFLISAAHAEEVQDPETRFALLCAEDVSTGFNWVDGAWKQANFRVKQHLLKKVDPALHPECGIAKNDTNDLGGIVVGQGCYEFNEVGQKTEAQACNENWSKSGTLLRLTKVHCYGLANVDVGLNGVFVVTRVYAYDDAQTDRRDSLALSVGKCSFVN